MRNWDKHYRAEDTPWDHGEPAPPLREYLRMHRIEGKVLVPGCGTGHDVRLLASQGAEVIGLDIAPGAIHKAEALPRQSREQYVLGDILNLPGHCIGAFDWVFEHTCLCALEPPQRSAYVEGVHEALKGNAQLLAIFYCVVEDYDGEGPPHPISPEGIDALFAGKFETLSAWTPEDTYPSRAGGKEQMRLMRRVG